MVLPLLSSLQKTTQKSVSTEAGTFVLGSFIISKSAGKRKQTVGTGAKREGRSKGIKQAKVTTSVAAIFATPEAGTPALHPFAFFEIK